MYDHHFHKRTLKYYQFFQHFVLAGLVSSFHLKHLSDVTVKPPNATAGTITKLVEKAEEFAEDHGVQPWLLVTILIGNNFTKIIFFDNFLTLFIQ